MTKNIFKDPLCRNIGYLSALVFVLSLQALIILVFVYQFIPMKLDPITQGVPPTLLKLFQPNRNHFFYHAFVAVAVLGQASGIYLLRKRLGKAELAAQIREVLIFETLWVSWQLFAAFKILQYGNPPWARILLYAGFTAGVLAKVFWPELKRGLNLFGAWIKGEIPSLWRYWADAGIILFLTLTMAIPDTQKAIVRLALNDNNNHFDQWLMAPLWALHKGLIPGLQFFNPLNWGVVALVHALAGMGSGISYGHVLGILVFLGIAYYILFYYFLRFWLGVLPAAFGALLAVKLQMFHMGISPLIWVFPQQSILRQLFDVLVFFSLLCYARGLGELFLWLAAALVGACLSVVFDTGVYMTGALYAYLIVLLTFKNTREALCPNILAWRKVLGLVFLPWILMATTLCLCFGQGVLHPEFWANSLSDLPRWLNGGDSVSIYSCLRDRNFYAFFASFFPPLMYMAGMTGVVSMVYFRRWKNEALFLIPLSVYGLGVYAHFLWHGTINYYYMAPLALVGSLCYWMVQYTNGLSKSWQRAVKLILGLIVAVGLLTNYYFTYYPNILNVAGEDWEAEKTFYRTNFNFEKDAHFVWYWTQPQQRVALISEFETQILMQADRAPFFYDGVPLMNETGIVKVLKQLDQNKPQQVFIDKKILNTTGNAAINALIVYLNAHYQYTGHQSDRLALIVLKV